MDDGLILAAESISKAFGGHTVLRNAGWWIRRGEITFLVGRNGAGKSTILNISCGLMKADTGVIIFLGERLLRPRLHYLAGRGLFFAPQDPLLARSAKIRDHFNLIVKRFPDHRFEEAVELLSVDDFLDYPLHELSTGMRRRIDLALAFSRNPTCLIADEPIVGINPTDQSIVLDAFRRIAKTGVGIGVTGHDVNTLLPMADSIVWMTAGTTHALGSPDKALMHDQFVAEYLGIATADRLKEGCGWLSRL